ncbi:MAG: alpha/beta fold hydrolase [Planctomycetota bacterium]|jgi:ABC-type transporter lipoprotein component MlaA/pimeloyl-ACP methyl ester carboxylesterase
MDHSTTFSRRRRLRPWASVLLVLLVAGCSTPLRKRDWSTYDGPGARYFQREELPPPMSLRDPIEGWNRGVGVFNHGLMVAIVDPVARGYRFIVPKSARDALTRFGLNLAYPKHLVNSLFQGKMGGAGRETARFFINTTIGLLGLFDPATSFGIEPSRESFGRTLGKWGWEQKYYFMFPLWGPNNVRGIIGSTVDVLLEPQSLVFPAAQILSFNNMSGRVDSYLHFTRTQYDPYELGRLLWTYKTSDKDVVYDKDRKDPQAPTLQTIDQASAAVQTLGAIYLQPLARNFPSQGSTRTVKAPSGRELTYNLWLHEGVAPIVYLVPGLGTHRDSSSVAALAELAHRKGFSVAAISSTMNWEFMQQAARTELPGHGPTDAAEVHAVLTAIHQDLSKEYPGRITRKVLMGASLGAFHAMLIAATAEQAGSKLAFDRYVAIAPPVRLLPGMKRIDDFYNAPLRYPAAERDRKVENTLLKLVRLDPQEIGPANPLPLDSTEAEHVIGLAFRLILQAVIHDARRAGYLEIFDYSYMEYAYAVMLPYLKKQGTVRDEHELFEQNSLRSRAARLGANQRIRVFTNRNDFLYDADDVQWLEQTFGDRLHLFEEGGHLGNVYRHDVKEAIIRSVADLVQKIRS